jgi:hypothetical protein
MAHAQKPDFLFRRNGRIHLNRRGCQFSRLLAAEVCASAVVMLDTSCSEVVWRVLATHSIRQFPLTSPPVRHRVPSHFSWSLTPVYQDGEDRTSIATVGARKAAFSSPAREVDVVSLFLWIVYLTTMPAIPTAWSRTIGQLTDWKGLRMCRRGLIEMQS